MDDIRLDKPLMMVKEPTHEEPTPIRLRAGDLCPQCRQTVLDFDGLLNLSCPLCGVFSGGCFT